MPEYMSTYMPNNMQERMSEAIPRRMPEVMTEDIGPKLSSLECSRHRLQTKHGGQYDYIKKFLLVQQMVSMAWCMRFHWFV